MKRLVAVPAILLLAFGDLPAQEAPEVRVSGRVSTGLQQLANDTDSSKLTEYRDLRDGLFLPDLRLNVMQTDTGRFLDLLGTNATRDDRAIRLQAGQPGFWRLDLEWISIPQALSTRAQTPFTATAPGRLEAPATVPVTFKRLATVSADAAGVLATDAMVAAYAQAFLSPVDLNTQRHRAVLAFQYSPLEALRFGAEYRRTTRAGHRLGYGPIGDRPPRTLNIQLAEPVDHRTGDLLLTAEHLGVGYQAQFEYQFSDFANAVDTLSWQNIYATPVPGADFDVWDRAVSAFGRRPLAPDNRHHQALVSLGSSLPLDSRLTGTVSYGRLEQNESLLPYSYHAGVANPELPRMTAAARMQTTSFAADYVLSPLPRTTVRAFFRRYDLDNRTAEARWQYVTSDTSNLNGTVSYKNKRVNLAYDFMRQNAGVDATVRSRFWRSSAGLAYEREDIERAYRETDTVEHVVRASWRARPVPGMTVRARYVHGRRDGEPYDWAVTRRSYWYAPGEATDNDNPLLTFSNHPDMRRSDVADRSRNQADVTLGVTPRGNLSLSATVRYRRDDFDSGTRPVQPLIALAVADRDALTPGDQLGLLDDRRRRYSIDAFYAPTEQVTVNAFVGWEGMMSQQRSLEFQENAKANPSTVEGLELGPWTRRGSQWLADTDDRTRTVGAGVTFARGSGMSVSASYTVALGRIDIEYAGFGLTNFDGRPFPDTHQFGFRTPSTIRHEFHVVDTRLEIPVAPQVRALVGYTYDRYRLADWQQEADTPWFEPVGTEFLLRDTSRSHQWGNRLFTMGTELAPSYRAHVGYVSIVYRF